jgi:hypothetical protein
MNLETATKLCNEGICKAIQPLPLNQSVTIVFGKKSAREPVIGTISCGGLLDTIFIVKNAECTLISDSSFTDKGVIIIQDDSQLFGIANGEILFQGVRDKNATVSSNEVLYNLDIRSLISAPNPNIINNQIKNLELSSAESIVHFINNNISSNANSTSANVNITASAAKPSFKIGDVRSCRKLIKGWGNRSPFSLADTIENNAVKNIPYWLTPALLRAIAHSKSNIPQLLSCVRQQKRGGTGIRSVTPGQCVSFAFQ